MKKSLFLRFVPMFILYFSSCTHSDEIIDYSIPSGQPLIVMTLNQIEPLIGPSIGGTKVILKGDGFPRDAKVIFHDQLANQVEWISSSELHVLSPAIPGMQGKVSVKVVDSENKNVSSEQKFSYFTSNIRFIANRGNLLDVNPQALIALSIKDSSESKLAVVTAKDQIQQMVSFFSWDASLARLAEVQMPSYHSAATVLTLGDFNGDGQRDLVLGDPAGGISVLFQDGKGGLLDPHTFTVSQNLKWMDVADVNQDNALDLISVSQDQVTTLLNNKRGSFSLSQSTFVGQNSQSFSVGDIDDDQKVDLVVVANQKLYLLLGNGDGTFQIPYPRPMDDTPKAVALADLNHDGKMDFLVTASDSFKKNKLLLWLSKDGNPPDIYSFPTTILGDSIQVEDINGDGFLDVIVSSLTGSVISIFMGTDINGLEAVRDFDIGGGSKKPIITDVNGDRRPDLVMISSGEISSRVNILLNDSQ